MSVTDRSDRELAADRGELPTFELSYLFDSRDDPSEVTVFPESSEHDISTNWITIDAGHAVALEELR